MSAPWLQAQPGNLNTFSQVLISNGVFPHLSRKIGTSSSMPPNSVCVHTALSLQVTVVINDPGHGNQSFFTDLRRAGAPYARLPGGRSCVTTEPAPILAPAPILTGATNMRPEPMKAPSPISVGCLCSPS